MMICNKMKINFQKNLGADTGNVHKTAVIRISCRQGMLSVYGAEDSSLKIVYHK